MPFEGKHNVVYLDPPGIPTICYGHTQDVVLGQKASDAECEAFLRADMLKANTVIDRVVKVPLPDARRAALISFVYNTGEGRFVKSTLLRKLNAGNTRGACDELLRWVYAGGKKLPGLVKRRAAEHELCVKGLSP